jgi:type VI secretion system secreted protein VgrG
MAMKRVMEITTPLGDDMLLFHRMQARDEISRLFEFEIDLLSRRPDIDLDKILGQNVSVKLELLDDSIRYFNGFVTRFAQVGTHGRYHAYHATVRPWLWFLTRTSNCRIFQEMTVPDIIAEVFQGHSVADFKKSLTGTYRKWEYCVQYRESDFNFVSRLMEQEGIYFYFEHQDGRHTLVLADSPSAHSPVTGYEQIPYIPLDRTARPEQEYINEWDFSREIQPGRYMIDDFDFKRPSVELQVKVKTTRQHHHELADYELYDYPGEYVTTGEGDHYVRARMGEADSQFEQARARTNARGASVGHLFKLTGHVRADQNREYLVLAATHQLEYSHYEAMDNPNTSYSCGLTVLDSRQTYRPQRATPKPMVQGPQTAIVVGPSGEEIFTDEYGRVKVQFHWDRYGKQDEKSSCWMRVSHPWAGNKWGMIAIPRIGHEVIVDFMEGDPDRPIITGRVYNAEQMPPYALPGNKTQTGIKTRSSMGGNDANFNEIRFEDKKGSEQLYIHAEKNQDISVENDETHTVGHDRTKTIDHDETSHIKHDRTETVDNNEKITIGVDRTENVGSNESITIGANRTEKVGANEDITIGANRTETVGANESVTVAANQDVTVGANRTDTVGGGVTQTIGGAVTQTIAAALTQTVGGAWSMTATGPVMITAPAGLTIVSPGGNRTIDNMFDKIGGFLTQTFGSVNSVSGMSYQATGIAIAQTGSKVETTGIAHGVTGLNNEVKGVNMAYVVLKCEKASFEIKTADVHIIA